MVTSLPMEVHRKPSLLIFNYTMDPMNPLLSHQSEVVDALAGHFEKITVITAGVNKSTAPINVHIVSTSWKPKARVTSIFRFYRKALPIVFSGDYDSVFFHMTDVQCALIAPLLRFLGKKQVLWYAHSFKSIYLAFSSNWVSTIVTSTSGSCPLKSQKVKLIGQAINPLKFPAMNSNELNYNNLIHIGRFDKSKNISLLISSAIQLRNVFPQLRLTIIGSPSSPESKSWAKNLIASNSHLVSEGWLHFENEVPRSEFPEKIKGNGCFFHAYMGSLDKTLIESTMLRVPVITINPEYLGIFGSWSKLPEPSLIEEFLAFRETSEMSIEVELERRLLISIDQHSMENWVRQLSRLLS